jgi:hypothetical protein
MEDDASYSGLLTVGSLPTLGADRLPFDEGTREQTSALVEEGLAIAERNGDLKAIRFHARVGDPLPYE